MYCRHHACRTLVGFRNGPLFVHDYGLIITRTNVYNYTSAFYFLASVSGSGVGSLLLSHHVYILNGLSILCYLLTMLLALLVSPDCGRDRSKDQPTESSSSSATSETEPLLQAVSCTNPTAPGASSTVPSSSQPAFQSSWSAKQLISINYHFSSPCCVLCAHLIPPSSPFSHLQIPPSPSSSSSSSTA